MGGQANVACSCAVNQHHSQKLPSGRYVRYTGFRQGYVLEPVMDKYIARFQELASDDVPATIVELHAGKAIVRRGRLYGLQ